MAKKKQRSVEEEYRLFIQNCVDKYAPVLLLSNHTIILEKDNGFYLACKYRYPYLDGIVIYSDSSLRDWQRESKKYHERKILHELCHLVSDPFYAKATTQYTSKGEIEDERERMTDHIAVIVHKLMGETCT